MIRDQKSSRLRCLPIAPAAKRPQCGTSAVARTFPVSDEKEEMGIEVVYFEWEYFENGYFEVTRILKIKTMVILKKNDGNFEFNFETINVIYGCLHWAGWELELGAVKQVLHS